LRTPLTENEVLYSYALLTLADKRTAASFAENDIGVCLAVLTRPDAGKNLTITQLDYLRDVTDRTGLDPGRFGFP
jgi:hypothetical protein